MENYSIISSSIHSGSVIKFKEYSLDRHERKKLSLEIDGAVVQDIIGANQPISKDLMVRYYGEGLDDTTYLQLSSVNCMRVVLIVGNTEDNQPIYKVILFNQDFYNLGLQEIEVINEVSLNEPNYVQQMNQMFPNIL